MNQARSPLVWGLVLITLGALFLLQSLGIVGSVMAPLWVLIFALGGACSSTFSGPIAPGAGGR
jgi:hypothetical protein